MRAQFVASEMVIGLRRNITMILSVVLAVAVSLFLVGFALLVRDQVDRAKGYWYDKVQVSVFLCYHVVSPHCPSPATQGQMDAIRTTLNGLSQVESVTFESHTEAADRPRHLLKDSRALPAQSPPENIPESYRVSSRTRRRRTPWSAR